MIMLVCVLLGIPNDMRMGNRLPRRPLVLDVQWVTLNNLDIKKLGYRSVVSQCENKIRAASPFS